MKWIVRCLAVRCIAWLGLLLMDDAHHSAVACADNRNSRAADHATREGTEHYPIPSGTNRAKWPILLNVRLAVDCAGNGAVYGLRHFCGRDDKSAFLPRERLLLPQRLLHVLRR